jgi:RimJ/RimL family protein N-acetyltransferase
MDYGVNEMKLKTIIGKAAHENTGSINVLKKMGMIYFGEELCGHDPAGKYILKTT